MNQNSLNDLLPKFIDHLKELGRSPATILAYRSDLQQLVDFVAEQKNKTEPKSIEREDVEAFRDFLLKQKYTPKSTSRKLNAIKTFFRWMKEVGAIIHDKSEKVEHPKIESTEPKHLNQIEYRALRDTVRQDPRVAAIVELILQTGMRISEIANLKVSQVTQETVFIEAYANQPARDVTINKTALEAVQEYLKVRPQTQSQNLFVSKTGRPLAVRNIRATIDRYTQKAEIATYSVNDIRTTFIVENLKRGVDINLVSKAAGHKRVSTTERYLELAGVKESGKKDKLEIL